MCYVGQAVTVLLLGGSWTSGSGVQNPTNSWAANFFAWINATFPHSDHVLVNNSTRGVTSGYVELCLHTYVIQDADLVVLEFDVNDGFHDRIEQQTRQDMPWWEDHFDSPTRYASFLCHGVHARISVHPYISCVQMTVNCCRTALQIWQLTQHI